MTRTAYLTAASLAVCAAALWPPEAGAAQFSLRITAPAGTTVVGSYTLTRDDGARIEEQIPSTGPGELRFDGRAVRLKLSIATGRGPVQAELLRDGAQVAQAMASGASGVLILNGGR